MYLIDKTYFTGKITVPNSTEYDGSNSIDSLEVAIDNYVRVFLKDVLGSILFNELDPFVRGVVLSNSAPQKWKDLIDGCTYLDGKKTWVGLRSVSGLHKESILAYFVYLNYYSESNSSGSGQVIISGKNVITVNPTAHLTEIFNVFVEKYQGAENCSEPITYGYFIDWFNSASNGYVSLLEYLEDNKDQYPTYSAKPINFGNQLGI